MGELVRIPEFLFTKQETDLRRSGEKQFDYLATSVRERQLEMEKACTSHLRKVGALLRPPFKEVDFTEQNFPVEASVVIPVRNRIRTIRDAVESVLSQKTSFAFNLIVVDNHSTDGTTELLAEFAVDKKLIHIIPERKDLGIGGCWNEAVFSPFCGKFAVQLDSDDLYSDENTLQTIVDKFYDDKCAMVIGSYRMTDFDLNEIPPGVIRHDEWTLENGPNNALRINGLGAPRAFYTPVLRQTGVPNVSYGEDYAVGLAISREYKIGRIYEPIYLCRRWDDNTDASLDIAKLNAHNHYKDWIRTVELKARKELVRNLNLNSQLHKGSELWKRYKPDETGGFSELAKSLVRDQQETWPLLKQNYEGLDKTETKVFGFDGFRVVAQYNPERIRSSAAKTDAQSIAERPCFLCPQNLPPQQKGFMIFEKYLVLANPYPIFPVHLTISDLNHTPQKIEGRLGDLLRISRSFEGFTVFYNGPKCGASAPDHFHFQAGIRGFLPVEEEVATNSVLIRNDNKINIRASRDYLRTFIAFESGDAGQIEEQFEKFIREMERLQHPVEPMMNIVCWFEIGNWQLVVFPRGKQRPCHFYLEGDEKIVVGPAAVEMGGVMVLPRKEDFEKITSLDISEIYREVSLGEDEFGELIETAKTQWRKDS
jgi:glycosyltransferase involved in cell wall biosynthesis